MHSDPIADMLTRIRNALMAGHREVLVPQSKIKLSLAEMLRQQGYINGYTVVEQEPAPLLRLQLKYVGERRDRRPAISGLKRISKPGRRVYVGRDEIPWVLSGIGICIMSTPRGVMTGQEARRLGVGGEVLCYVW